MRSIRLLALLLLATACRRTELGTPAPALAPFAVAEELREPEGPKPAAPAETWVEAEPPARKGGEAEKPMDENAIYRWEDAQRVVHFGRSDEIPPNRRASAKLVEAGVSEVRVESVQTLPSRPSPAPVPAQDTAPPQASARAAPGDEPELDENGLPIPGTMNETAHTRAVREATGGQQLDPASVERRREEDNRRMNCRVVDGVTICG
jgi:hypothetical protein